MVAPEVAEGTRRRFSFFEASGRARWKGVARGSWYPCCFGLDVHKKSITELLSAGGRKGERREEALRDIHSRICCSWPMAAQWRRTWAMENRQESVMKPVWNVLAEQFFEALLVTAHECTNTLSRLPAERRTEDSEWWIAELLQHGCCGGFRASGGLQGTSADSTRYLGIGTARSTASR